MAEENRVYLEVMNYIKEGLRDGTLEAGAKLPTERDMSAQLNISRNSIREALRTLDNMGVLECRQGSGNYLRGTLGHGFTDALSMHILMAAVSTREIVQVMRGIEIEADVMLKGTRVDGVYTADPEKDATATKFNEITYKEVLARGLKVMDLTAICMCQDNNLPIYVFNMDIVGNLKKVMAGEEIGTLVHP